MMELQAIVAECNSINEQKHLLTINCRVLEYSSIKIHDDTFDGCFVV